MKLQMRFKLETKDEADLRVTAYPPDIARWEAKYNKSLGSADLRIHDMLWLSWAAMVRQGMITAGQERQNFDRWMDRVLNIEPEDDQETAESSDDPTAADTPQAASVS